MPYADDAQAVDKVLAYAVLETSTQPVEPNQPPAPVPVDPTLDDTQHRIVARGSVRIGEGIALRIVPTDEAP